MKVDNFNDSELILSETKATVNVRILKLDIAESSVLGGRNEKPGNWSISEASRDPP